MLKYINLKKFTANALMATLLIGSGIIKPTVANSSQSGSSVPVGISGLQTQNVPATPNNVTTVGAPTTGKWNKTNPFRMNFGTGNNRKLTGFTVGSDNYQLLQLVNQVKFRRVNNSQVQGERHIFFLEKGSNDNQVRSSQINSMEEAVRSPYINVGTDNVFANQGGVNFNNIERVDFLIPEGTMVKSQYVDKVGFLLLERGGNDPFKIAPITAVDANGKPTQFGNLVSVPVSTWGNSGININTTVLQNDPSWSALRPSDTVGSQEIKGVFISLASLGIQTNDVIYGYALFPNDINANHDLVGLSNFPTNTSSDSGQGGLDLISSGGIFVPSGTSTSEVFTKPPEPNNPPNAVNDTVQVYVGQSININPLVNDTDSDGDTLTVSNIGTPTGGTATLTNGQVVYTAPSTPGTRTLNYTISDGQGGTDTATITILVKHYAD